MRDCSTHFLASLATVLLLMIVLVRLPLTRGAADRSAFSDGRFLEEDWMEVAVPTEHRTRPEDSAASIVLPDEVVPAEVAALAGDRHKAIHKPLPALFPAVVNQGVPSAATLLYGTEWLLSQTASADEVDQPPRLSRLNVEYPREAATAGVQGRVVAGFVVEVDGSTSEVHIIEPLDPVCDLAVLEALEKAGFEPARRDGRTVRVWSRLSVLFRLVH